MNKLKTLKDIDEDFVQKRGQHIFPKNYIGTKLLRQGAIEWVKKAQIKGNNFYCTICEKFNCDCGSSDTFKIHHLDEVIKFIKHYYNLTEEELK